MQSQSLSQPAKKAPPQSQSQSQVGGELSPSVELLSHIRSVDTLSREDLAGKRVLLRTDLNTPLMLAAGDVVVAADNRLLAALPTMQLLLGHNAIVIVASHLGRPAGIDKAFSLRPVADRLAELLKPAPVSFLENCVGENVRDAVMRLAPGSLVVLENTRFHREEELNDRSFAAELASLAEIYCDDAFGSAHRAHASTAATADFFHTKVAGLLMMKELSFLGPAIANPRKPFAVLLGGAKVSSKLPLLFNLVKRCDKLIIGGGMAFTFLRASGLSVGCSLVEESLIKSAQEVMEAASKRGVQLILPQDCVVARDLSKEAAEDWVLAPVTDMPDDMMGLDIGPATLRLFRRELESCRTVLWNGPMGVCELDAYKDGTDQMIDFLASLTTEGCCTIVGGGDTVAAIERNGNCNFTHVSSGGGATLEMLEGKQLPGVLALMTSTVTTSSSSVGQDTTSSGNK